MDKDICMLADKEVVDLVDLGKYEHYIKEIKVDGDRILFVNGVLLNRRGYDVTKQYPQIKITNKDTILDGEMVFITDEKRGGHFNVGRRKENWSKNIYVIFDVLKFEGELLTNKPLTERRNYLAKVIASEFVKRITEFSIPEKLEGYEGLMLKNPNSKYVIGRTTEWLKCKPRKKITIDFTGYEINPDNSITAYNEFGHRVKVGKDVMKAREIIDREGKCSIEVNYLEQNPITKMFRQITLSEVRG